MNVAACVACGAQQQLLVRICVRELLVCLLPIRQAAGNDHDSMQLCTAVSYKVLSTCLPGCCALTLLVQCWTPR